jgi:hypothetical protein
VRAELAKVVAVHLPAARRVTRWGCLEAAVGFVVAAATMTQVRVEPAEAWVFVSMMSQHLGGRSVVVVRSVGWDGLGLKVVLEAWHCCCFLCRSLALTHQPGRVD